MSSSERVVSQKRMQKMQKLLDILEEDARQDEAPALSGGGAGLRRRQAVTNANKRESIMDFHVNVLRRNLSATQYKQIMGRQSHMPITTAQKINASSDILTNVLRGGQIESLKRYGKVDVDSLTEAQAGAIADLSYGHVASRVLNKDQFEKMAAGEPYTLDYDQARVMRPLIGGDSAFAGARSSAPFQNSFVHMGTVTDQPFTELLVATTGSLRGGGGGNAAATKLKNVKRLIQQIKQTLENLKTFE